MSTVPYVVDGGLTGSGILDVSRQVKERIKAFAYAYRLSNDSSWAERAWVELFVGLCWLVRVFILTIYL